MLVNVNYSIIHHYHLLIRTNKNYNFNTSCNTENTNGQYTMKSRKMHIKGEDTGFSGSVGKGIL